MCGMESFYDEVMASSTRKEKFLCQPCSKDKKEINARSLCFECKEPLCEECSRLHLRFSQSERHHLIELVPYLENLKLQQKQTRPTSAVNKLVESIDISSETNFYKPAQAPVSMDNPNPQSSSKGMNIKATKVLEFSLTTSTGKKVDSLIGAIFVAETIVVFDINSLHMFDCHGTFILSRKANAETRCITPVSESSFASSGFGNRVYLWNIEKRRTGPNSTEEHSICESKSYKVEHAAHGIHFNGLYFSVLHSVKNAITILTREGELVKKIIKAEAVGMKIRFGWDVHMDRETNNIYVPLDKEDGVLCLSLDEEVLWFTPMGSVRGITEIQGLLCVADVENACLHLMTKNGEILARNFLGEIELKGTPYSVSFANNDRLYITFEAPVDRRQTIIIYAISNQ